MGENLIGGLKEHAFSISVVMSVYNGAEYLREAIESILTQTYSDFELLIFNDASTDQSEDVILSFKDSRIFYRKMETNSGYVELRNLGFSMAKGKYIAIMDADDVALPTRFQEQFAFLEANQGIDICGSWYENFGSLSGVVKCPTTPEDITYSLFFGTPFGHSTVMIRNDFLKAYNLKYDGKFSATEDYDLFEKASLLGSLANIPRVLIRYRKHEAQITSTRWQEQYHVVGLIQARRLSRTIKEPDYNIQKWMEEYFTNRSIPNKRWFEEIELFKERIVKENITSKAYPVEILKKALQTLFSKEKINKIVSAHLYRKYYKNTRYNLNLLKLFFQDNYKPYKAFKVRDSIVFVIKCIIRYRK